MKIAAVLPAYNEADRIRNVIRAVRRAPHVDEIVVVNDCSTDNTAEVVSRIPGITLVNMPVNVGKGGAMVAGAGATEADILLFLDADLINLKPEHIEALIAPVRTRRYDMAVGKFTGGRKITDLAQKVAPNLTGQRVIRRDIFEQIPNVGATRYGVEMAITRFCRTYGYKTATVEMPGVTHPMKTEKIGFVRGWFSRMVMYTEILRIKLNPRKPVRTGRDKALPALIRRFAASQRRNGNQNSVQYWLYKQERRWKRRRSERMQSSSRDRWSRR